MKSFFGSVLRSIKVSQTDSIEERIDWTMDAHATIEAVPNEKQSKRQNATCDRFGLTSHRRYLQPVHSRRLVDGGYQASHG